MKPILFANMILLIAGACSGARGAELPGARTQAVAPEYMLPAGSRAFRVEYIGKVPEAPAGTKKLRVWMPVPQNSTAQSVRELKFSRTPRLTTEPKYGNTIAYWELDAPPPQVEIAMSFVCERKEVVLDLPRLALDGQEDSAQFEVFLRPDRLVIVDEQIRRLADDITEDKRSALEKARAIYEYVLGKMTYDKSHAGWGLGSTRHACEMGKGNCTDFHALFNSLCRAEGIASGFEIGLYLPYEKGRSEPLGGYHCWAFFRVPGKTWVPVDCSEADRFPDRKEFFFGGHTSNRVALSTGRDLTLEPPQAGEPLNYFLNPYAEADGQPVNTDKTWSYADLN